MSTGKTKLVLIVKEKTLRNPLRYSNHFVSGVYLHERVLSMLIVPCITGALSKSGMW